MIAKPLSDIVAADLDALVAGQTPEGRTLDYKAALPGRSDEDKRNFLYDVTALANTLGGDIIYGVRERSVDSKNAGIPEAVEGIDKPARDQEQLRLDNLLRTAVDPRIPGVSMRWIDHPSSERPTLIVRVPKSLLAPHMVTFNGLSRFYGRATNGNFVMDVSEIRTAFEMSGDLGRRMRSFRAERLAQIEAGVPMALDGAGRMILHVVPMSALQLGANVNLSEPVQGLQLLSGVSADRMRFNVDGYLCLAEGIGYVQIFRSGALEAVDGYFANSSPVPSSALEQEMVGSVRNYVWVLQNLGVRGPFLVALTLTRMKGKEWATKKTDWDYAPWAAKPVFDREFIALPEIIIEPDDGRRWSARLKPIIDALWQAAGRKGSQNYTEKGEWRLIDGL